MSKLLQANTYSSLTFKECSFLTKDMYPFKNIFIFLDLTTRYSPFCSSFLMDTLLQCHLRDHLPHPSPHFGNQWTPWHTQSHTSKPCPPFRIGHLLLCTLTTPTCGPPKRVLLSVLNGHFSSSLILYVKYETSLHLLLCAGSDHPPQKGGGGGSSFRSSD